jgi:hypothetical protein
VNIVVVCSFDGNDDDFNIDRSKKEFAVEEHKWVTIKEACENGKYDKYVRLNIEKSISLGLLMNVS